MSPAWTYLPTIIMSFSGSWQMDMVTDHIWVLVDEFLDVIFQRHVQPCTFCYFSVVIALVETHV